MPNWTGDINWADVEPGVPAVIWSGGPGKKELVKILGFNQSQVRVQFALQEYFNGSTWISKNRVVAVQVLPTLDAEVGLSHVEALRDELNRKEQTVPWEYPMYCIGQLIAAWYAAVRDQNSDARRELEAANERYDWRNYYVKLFLTNGNGNVMIQPYTTKESK